MATLYQQVRWGLISVMAWLCATSSIAMAQSVTLERTDFKGVDLDLDQDPLIPVFTTDANIFSRATFAGDSENRVGAALSEYSLDGLNADGIFAAEFRANVTGVAQDPPGTRGLNVLFYEADGVVDTNDLSNPSIRDPNRLYPSHSYESNTESGLSISMDVTNEVREAIYRGSGYVGASISAAYPQGTSTIFASDAPVFEVTEYYDDPFDALPVFSGSTGLVYRGHSGEFVTNGETEVVGDDIATFNTYVRNDHSIDVQIFEDSSPGDFYLLSLNSDDGELLQAGDSFEGTRTFLSNGASLDFSAKGSGLSEAIFGFTIHDIAYDSQDDLERIDVSFWQGAYQQQTDELPFGGPKAFGRLRINITAVPEPSCIAAIGMVSGGVLLRRRSRRSAR
ncbi:PEP-CTERM sorting domain-containing protein [Rhodopirellula sp. MGV]|uniref:PEP-CTERM sorting domain-containing protein n=1 Tax=Rhodopirellula sp. MGV TaxID=2023130 RepID=UPI000B96848C|nr:PEP-CTERM sorting domain-containing protein [Rhodopirellula sp. MGV]OYP38379.1 hypothetical protein CGZ80_02205 [Rhodopirellula sp. MGV]PNY34199.1 PEP-CTERM sorting domain-containing protein [Rhodopirellula baltica]